MVNDGLPLLYKNFKSSITTFTQKYLPQYKSIEFEEISMEDIDHHFASDSHESSILLNHPNQFELSAFNMKQLYVAIPAEQWDISPSTMQYFGNNISTCLDWANRANPVPLSWTRCSTDDLINESNITLRGTFKRYKQYITYLRHETTNRELILFHSNHLSIPLSQQIGKIIKNWQPDKVILESAAIRMHRYVQTMQSSSQNGIYKLLYNLSDNGIAAKAANKNIASHIILADWNNDQYRIMQRIARCLDRIQSKDAIDSSTNITLHVFGQLLFPSLLPAMKQSLLDEYYEDTLRINNPHLFCLYEKRNDIFANTIHHCGGRRLLGIFGHSHINPICKRLVGNVRLMNPFKKLGSHNIQF